MPASRFIEFIDENPQIRAIEIGNSGEVFLNPELPAMLKYAHDKGVTITIKQGSNLNDASDEALEALVKYGVALLKVSIDGSTQDTYQTYRVGGNLRKVLNNVQKINELKNRSRSGRPRLILQFIPFEHNEHEIGKIAVLAKALGMELFIKLNVFKGFLPVRDHEALTRMIGFHDTESFREKTGKIYMRNICLEIWRSPQVSWDGRLLGCSHNVSGVYADNALGGRFAEEINNGAIRYAETNAHGSSPRPRRNSLRLMRSVLGFSKIRPMVHSRGDRNGDGTPANERFRYRRRVTALFRGFQKRKDAAARSQRLFRTVAGRAPSNFQLYITLSVPTEVKVNPEATVISISFTEGFSHFGSD